MVQALSYPIRGFLIMQSRKKLLRVRTVRFEGIDGLSLHTSQVAH